MSKEFLEIIEAMDVSQGTEKALSEVLSRVISIAGFEFGCIHVMEDDLLVCIGVQKELASKIKENFPDEIDKALDRGEVCFLSDFYGVRSAVFIPMLKLKERIGLMGLGANFERMISDRERLMLKSIGRMIGVLLHNALIAQREQRLRGQLELLLTVANILVLTPDWRETVAGILDLVRGYLEAKWGTLTWIDIRGSRNVLFSGISMDECEVRSFPQRRGVTAIPIEQGLTVRVDDVTTHPRFTGLPEGHVPIGPYLAAPIFLGNDPAGDIALAREPGSKPFTEEDENFLVAVADQMSIALEAHLTNERLIESEMKYRALAESDLVGVYVIQDNKLVYANNKMTEIFGYSKEELLDLGPMDLTAPEDRELVMENIRKRLEGEVKSVRYRFRGLRKDGERPLLEVHGTIASYMGKPAIVGLMIDRTEEELIQQRLRQTERLTALGNLAGGIAHDFNNLLAAILGYASYMRFKLTPQHPFYRPISTIEETARRAADLIRQLNLFAKGGAGEKGPVNLNFIVDEVTRMLSEVVDRSIRIMTDLAQNLWTVRGDPTQLHQVLMNLCVNARDAMPEGGELRITTENVVTDQSWARLHPGAKPGRYVRLSVGDTGVGMDEETQARIFEPFFTTKGERGTGLGLAVVYGIVKEHGGEITVYSRLGEGTTFKIYLPAMEQDEKGRQKAVRAEERIRKGSETVLVVDDEPNLRTLARDILNSAGYKVMLAEDGTEAVRILSEHRDEIALVILDLSMPGMSGEETFNRMREIKPNLKVIIATGYSRNGTVEEMLSRGALGYIGKPYHMFEILSKVGEAIEGER
jgi:PAS domain S-box-containing protein